MNAVVASLAALAFVLSTADARAAEGEDVVTLEQELGREYATLSTEDCVTACRALASIRRAADRICALEPGPRCDDARAKATDANRRVTEACPDCAIAGVPGKDDERRAAQAPEESPALATAQSERGRGGCASCATAGGHAGGGDLGTALVAALAVARLARRRRVDRPPP